MVGISRLSTSVNLLQPAGALSTGTLTRSVVGGANVGVGSIRLLPVTLLPVRVTHAGPSRYWTSKAVTPYCLTVVASVGSTGLAKSVGAPCPNISE